MGKDKRELWIVPMNNPLVERPPRAPRSTRIERAELTNCSAYVCERITREGRDECFGTNVVTNCQRRELGK
jgi:hypothetical protein